jgi:hypothetical protein
MTPSVPSVTRAAEQPTRTKTTASDKMLPCVNTAAEDKESSKKGGKVTAPYARTVLGRGSVCGVTTNAVIQRYDEGMEAAAEAAAWQLSTDTQ